jgi:heat shock protein HtpX
MWESIFMPGRNVPVPSILRTHPSTEERVRRLRELHETRRPPLQVAGAEQMAPRFAPRRPAPSYHLSGLWY